MNRYRKGVRFENLVRKRFEAAGYFVVRSAGSKGAADLVAVPRSGMKNRTLLIQAKTGLARIPAEERKRLRLLHVHAEVVEVWGTPKNMICSTLYGEDEPLDKFLENVGEPIQHG